MKPGANWHTTTWTLLCILPPTLQKYARKEVFTLVLYRKVQYLFKSNSNFVDYDSKVGQLIKPGILSIQKSENGDQRFHSEFHYETQEVLVCHDSSISINRKCLLPKYYHAQLKILVFCLSCIVKPDHYQQKPVEEVTLIRKADLENHNKDGGMWVVIHGKVYDIQDFKIQAPCGADVLMQYAGEYW